MPIGKITDKEERLLKEKALWGKLEVRQHNIQLQLVVKYPLNI